MKMKIDINHKYFHTTDINIASILMTLGFSLQGVNKSNPNKILFLFTDSSKIEKTINEFYARKIKVEPLELFYSQRLLKNIIFSR